MICNLLLVTRVFPFAEASGDKPPFARASGDEPPFARASGDEPSRRQAATPPQRGTCSAAVLGVVAPSVVKGNPDCGGNALSSPPLEGWATPGPARCVAWVVKPGVVRDCGIIHLLLILCHSRARGPRKHEYVCGVDNAGIGAIKFISRITSE